MVEDNLLRVLVLSALRDRNTRGRGVASVPIIARRYLLSVGVVAQAMAA